MDKKLQTYSLKELKDIAKSIDIPISGTKSELSYNISKCLKKYERYKRKVNKYVRLNKIGNTGKDGITYLVKYNGKQYAMKTFRKTKSGVKLKIEYDMLKLASFNDISPKPIEYDEISKYIVMDVMEKHLIDVIKEQGYILTEPQQKRIVNIYNTLDRIKIFHNDANIYNYMVSNGRIYIIDFGISKYIDDNLTKKLGTSKPNLKYMTLGLILKLKEFNCNPISYKYLESVI